MPFVPSILFAAQTHGTVCAQVQQPQTHPVRIAFKAQAAEVAAEEHAIIRFAFTTLLVIVGTEDQPQ
jgi:hypothetical protein